MNERITLGGTDGFRGQAVLDQSGPGLVNEETFAGLSATLIHTLHEAGESGVVVVSRDTRPSGARLANAVISGVYAEGGEVIDLGIAPTPTAQKVAEHVGAMATIVVTASHNKASDNGWKGMLGSDKPSQSMSKQLSDTYWQLIDSGLAIPEHRSEPATAERKKYASWYEQRVLLDVREAFGSERPLDGKIIVVDGANGAGRELTPRILEALGATIETFACGYDGEINAGCGAADLIGVKEYLRKRPDLLSNPNFLGAIANDGDADRMMAIGVIDTHEGSEVVEINGNHVMWALAQDQQGLVGTEYTNSGLVNRLRKENIDFDYCANGDVFVTQKLREKQAAGLQWTRGGEFTGHYVDLDWLSSGDGVRAAAWFASWATQNKMSFGDVYNELPLWSEVMQKVPLTATSKNKIENDDVIKNHLIKLEEKYDGLVRFVARASGTEPLYRVWGEGRSIGQARMAVKSLVRVVNERTRELAI
jgi:phosphoglucosamine mutase